MKKLYVVSSTEFENLDDATDKLQFWLENGHLDREAEVYEVKRIYKPIIELAEQ